MDGNRHLRPLAIAFTLLAPLGCDKTGEQAPPVAVPVPSQAEPAAAVTKAPAAELLATAVERRLHPERVEASSFLWNDWNRFQENYHPNYLLDDDPATAWVEGAAGMGDGQWVRVHVSDNSEASAIRLRLRNGYHKSKSLHRKNARAKAVTVTTSPGDHSAAFVLKDTMEWQTIELEQPSGDLSAIEIRIDSVYPGTKYADLCLSDLEVFVTSRTPENPEFESGRFAAITTWKKERLAAAALFASKAGKQLPIAASYRVTDNKTVATVKNTDHSFTFYSAMTAIAEQAGKNGVGGKDLTALIAKAAAAKFASWVPVEVSVKAGRAFPAIDGLATPEIYTLDPNANGPRSNYSVPFPPKVEFLTSSRLSAFESSSKVTVDQALAGKAKQCKSLERHHTFFFRPPETIGKDNGVLRRLLVVVCGQEAERDSAYTVSGLQLLEYDERGFLHLVVSANEASVLDWSEAGKVSSGRRVVRAAGNYTVDHLELAKNL